MPRHIGALTCRGKARFHYLPTGIDLRVMEGEEFRRTQLVKDGPAVQELADEWREKLLAAGWADR